MKNLVTFIFFAAYGLVQADEPAKPKEKIPTTIEVRCSYFLPESSTYRDFYHNGGADYQLTGTVPFYQGDLNSLRGLNFWWAADYFQKHGSSVPLHNHTKIQMEPVTVGLKWIYPEYCVRPYFGLALKYYFIQITSDSPYVKRHMNENGAGFVTEAGLQIMTPSYFMLDIFTSYSFKQFGAPSSTYPNVEGTWLDVGGWNFGGGVGVKF